MDEEDNGRKVLLKAQVLLCTAIAKVVSLAHWWMLRRKLKYNSQFLKKLEKIETEHEQHI